MTSVDECNLVDDSGESTADERTSPVNPVVGPRPAHNSWSESDGWVHGGSAESSTGEDVSSDDETDSDWCDCSEAAVLGVDGGGVDSVDEPEGHYDLEDESVHGSHSVRETKRRNSQATGGEFEEEASDDGAKKLSDPVEDTTEESDVTTDEGTEGNGGIHVSTGDVSADRNSDEETESMSQGSGNEAGRSGGSIVSELVKSYA